MEFHRIQLEEWHSVFRTAGFVIFLAVFTLMLLRVRFLSKSKVEHDASLPLQDERTRTSHAHGNQDQTRP